VGDYTFSYGVITRGGWDVLNENGLAPDSSIFACTRKIKWVGYIADNGKMAMKSRYSLLLATVVGKVPL
jgi:hypothetical protein